jgi:hypothetical protein
MRAPEPRRAVDASSRAPEGRRCELPSPGGPSMRAPEPRRGAQRPAQHVSAGNNVKRDQSRRDAVAWRRVSADIGEPCPGGNGAPAWDDRRARHGSVLTHLPGQRPSGTELSLPRVPALTCWAGRWAPLRGSGPHGGIRPARTRPARIRSARIRSARTRPARIRSARIRSARTRPARTRPARIRPARIRSARIRSAGSQTHGRRTPLRTRPATSANPPAC